MHSSPKYLLYALFAIIFCAAFRNKELGPWKEKQLISTETLAGRIRNGDTARLLILNTGPVENIQGAVTFGAVENPKNLEKLEAYVQTVPKDREIVLYCGCCPLAVCPNLRPAYDMLKSKKFKSCHVLKLVHELQEDWIDKGYPTQP